MGNKIDAVRKWADAEAHGHLVILSLGDETTEVGCEVQFEMTPEAAYDLGARLVAKARQAEKEYIELRPFTVINAG